MERWGLYKQVSSLGGYFMRVINHFYVPHSTLYLSRPFTTLLTVGRKARLWILTNLRSHGEPLQLSDKALN